MNVPFIPTAVVAVPLGLRFFRVLFLARVGFICNTAELLSNPIYGLLRVILRCGDEGSFTSLFIYEGHIVRLGRF